ncbi:MAG: hypothetical protein K8M05_18275, partial [Deltaproteobacteria bacterium]|nr:hypothetical protein [Kofleriaceae bacterium]
MRKLRFALVTAALALAASPAAAAPRLTLVEGEREPAGARTAVGDAELAKLRAAVAAAPDDRA